LSRPNVVLVVFDTARATAFEPWGAPPGSTPTVAQLASKGTAVAHAVSTCNWTMPSHASIFSGSLPRSIGLGDVPEGNPAACQALLDRRRDHLLPEVMRRAGYRTSAATANAWVSALYGFDIGFDDFLTIGGRRRTDLGAKEWWRRLLWLYQGLVARVDDGAAAGLEAARRWLVDIRGSKEPFFWFFNLVECHSPYMPPRPWNDLGPVQRLRTAAEAGRHLTMSAIWRARVCREEIPPGALQRMRHLYGRACSYMDHWLATLLGLLDEQGVLDDTWVVVTSDHGENLGEGGMLGHAFSLDERLVHVPLVVCGPDSIDLPAFMSTRSLPALIGTVAGLDPNPWTELEAAWDGVAIAQYNAMCRPDDPRLQLLEDWPGFDDEARAFFTNPMTMASDGHRKLVRFGGRWVLYDLDTDRAEVAPRLLGDPAVPEARHLWESMSRADATDMDAASLRAIAGSADTTTDEALEAQMRLLGYM
jgi:hypothetical protein